MLSSFLEGYQTLTTIIGDEMTDNAIVEAIKCHRVSSQQASYRLYTVNTYYQSVERDRRNPIYGYNLNPYSQSEAFHCEANMSMIMEQILPAIAFRNPIARVVLLIRGIAKYDMMVLFWNAWTRFKMLDVLVLSRIDYRTILICVFNPYLTPPGVMFDERNLFCYPLRTMEDAKIFQPQLRRFINERITNLRLYPLKVAITDVDLMSKAMYFANGTLHRYQYLDGEMVEIMRERMNFTIEYIQLNYQESVGFISSNGSLGGTLEMLEHNTIDLAANSRSIMQHPMRNLQYVHFLCPIQLIFVVPINYFRDRYKMVFFHPFSLQMYMTNVALAVLLPFLLLVLMRREFSIATYAKETFRTLAVVFASSVALPRDYRHRLVLMGLMFYSIIAYSAWQGVTIIQLNQNDDKLRNIQTLEELVETDLHLKAIVSFGNAIRSKIWNGSDVRGRIAARIEVQWIPSNLSIIPEVANNRTSAVPIIEYFIEVVRSRYFDEQRKQSKVHFIQQPFIEYLTAMALPKNSPLFPTIRRLTMNCLENGIVNYQLSFIRHKGMLLQIAQNRNKTLRDEPQTLPILPDYLVQFHTNVPASVIYKNFSLHYVPKLIGAVSETVVFVQPTLTPTDHSPTIEEENGSIGILLGVKALVQLFANPLVGSSTARFGYCLPITFGTINLLLASLIFGFGTSYSSLFVARAIHGLGSACIGVCGMSLVAQLYPEPDRRSKVMGTVLGAMAVGVLVGYPFGGIAYEVAGKAAPFHVLAVLCAGNLVLQYFQLDIGACRRNPLPRDSSTTTDDKRATWWPLLNNRLVLVIVGGIWISTSAMAILEPCLPIWMINQLHPKKWQLGTVFIPDSIGYWVGTNFFGSVAYRFGQIRVAIVALLLVGSSCILIPSANTVAGLLLPHLGLGLGIGVVDAALVPLLATLVDAQLVSQPEHELQLSPNESGGEHGYGAVYAIQQIAVSVAYSLAPIVGGELVPIIGFPTVLRALGVLNILYVLLLMCSNLRDTLGTLLGSSSNVDTVGRCFISPNKTTSTIDQSISGPFLKLLCPAKVRSIDCRTEQLVRDAGNNVRIRLVQHQLLEYFREYLVRRQKIAYQLTQHVTEHFRTLRCCGTNFGKQDLNLIDLLHDNVRFVLHNTVAAFGAFKLLVTAAIDAGDEQFQRGQREHFVIYLDEVDRKFLNLFVKCSRDSITNY
uniref:Major facilitator superfamily (MFS) profile domain-containing protein n=1 Tax=Anopheles farauti TaxID=69004 RepID=A0A182QCQ9_9DIPT